MSEHIIYDNEYVTMYLTTEHSASSNGLPVLWVRPGGSQEEVYGPGDMLAPDISAARIVRSFVNQDGPGGGIFNPWGPKSEEGLNLAQQFLAQVPEGE